jgi:hypothetical protein
MSLSISNLKTRGQFLTLLSVKICTLI